MTYLSSAQKVSRNTERTRDTLASAGSQGIAMAPPAYGIDVVDRESVESAPEPQPARQPLADNPRQPLERPIEALAERQDISSGSPTQAKDRRLSDVTGADETTSDNLRAAADSETKEEEKLRWTEYVVVEETNVRDEPILKDSSLRRVYRISTNRAYVCDPENLNSYLTVAEETASIPGGTQLIKKERNTYWIAISSS